MLRCAAGHAHPAGGGAPALLERDDDLRHLEHVVAALEEGVEAKEERVVLDAPRVLRALGIGRRLVVEVDALEVAADAERRLELGDGAARLLFRDQVEDLLAAHELDGSVDDRVAHLADDDDEARGRVVELGVLPDEQQDVHDGAEELGELLEVVRRVEALEPLLERAQVLAVVVRLEPRGEDLLAELREGLAVRALGHVCREAAREAQAWRGARRRRPAARTTHRGTGAHGGCGPTGAARRWR